MIWIYEVETMILTLTKLNEIQVPYLVSQTILSQTENKKHHGQEYPILSDDQSDDLINIPSQKKYKYYSKIKPGKLKYHKDEFIGKPKAQ